MIYIDEYMFSTQYRLRESLRNLTGSLCIDIIYGDQTDDLYNLSFGIQKVYEKC